MNDNKPGGGLVPLIQPFAGLRPAAGYAAAVLAPPYDVLDTAEARARAAGRPWSFLHISRAEIDFPEGIDPHDTAVYAKAAENLERMMDQGVLRRDVHDCYYVYRMLMDNHVQTGLAAVASVAAYEQGRIRRHECTRPEKEDDRARQIEALNAHTGPVCLAYRANMAVDGLLSEIAAAAPDMDVLVDDGVRHMLWVVDEAAHMEHIHAALTTVDALYIADGHHRAAAAARVAAVRNRNTPAAGAGRNAFLVVMFPHDQMRILDYNRVITDLNGLSEDAFLSRLEARFCVSSADSAVRPACREEFGMYLPGRWFRLRLHAEHIPQQDPVGRLAVSLLSDNLIAPVLGIVDARRDPRIDFVGGSRGLKALEERVDSAKMAVAFSLHPTGMDELMAVADAGRMMPPKSTWFEPKLADGVVSHLLD